VTVAVRGAARSTSRGGVCLARAVHGRIPRLKSRAAPIVTPGREKATTPHRAARGHHEST
jgi:hypothetical protein